MSAHNQPFMLQRMVSDCLQALNLVDMKCKKGLFILAACLALTQGFCQSQTSLIGVWQNTNDNVTLELRSDNTGKYVQGSKTFIFNSPYSIQSVLGGWSLQYQITINGNTRTIYALVKELSSTQIKFLAFLTKEELESASEEIKNSGVTLTKSND
jgi:hypothetical protein